MKQTDINGGFSFSNMVPISFYNRIKDFIVFPNPSVDHSLNLKLSGFNEEEEVMVEILTMQGISLFSDKFRLTSTEQSQVKIDLKKAFPAGIYYVVIRSEHLKLSKLFIVKK